MKHLCACLWALAVAGPVLAAGPTLKEARERWLHGNYEEARGKYEALGQDPKQKAAAAVGISHTWQSQGEYDKALAVIDAALADSPKDADLHARRAEVLHLRGRWEEAEKAAEQALLLKKDHFLARWVRGQVYRDRADIPKADVDFRWFVRTYSLRSENDDDIKDPDELVLVGQAGAENARWHKLADQFKVILNDVYGDALKYDKDLWIAEYQAGALLLEKYNRGEALDAFDKALKINPHAAEALVGKGVAALQKFEIKDAEQFAERALKVNPNLAEALRLRADVHMMSGDTRAALRELERARKVNPRDESTLGRIAACFLLEKRQKDFDALAKEVEQFDPKPCIFYYELGERLEERRHFDPAEGYFKKAAELRPMVPWPQNSLGLLYMRLGREKEAYEVLMRAFEADQFNVRVSNTLKVLRHLDKYDTLETEHFVLRFDPERDKKLVHYMADYLEQVYADLAKKFQYQPKDKILLEVFNNHDMFSGRVVALPDLHTIGACTGRMVAMVSPRGQGIRRPFNWTRVIRHELVHIFNLEQTNFQVPHWVTEGLAVSNEGFARPQQWNQLLLEKVPKGDLLTLDNVDLGFIRPRSPVEWHQAYCQSQLYMQYMQEKFGPQTVGEILAAYRDGLDTAAAIQKVCKVSKAEFEKGYRAYVEALVKTIKGRLAEKTMSFTELRDANEKDPDDLEVAARLGEQYLIRRRNAEARKLAERVLAKNKTHPIASYVKARLLLTAGDDEEARKLLEAAFDPKSPDPRVLQALGKIYYELKEYKKAAEVYELARKVDPYEEKWLTDLARIYAQAGDKDKHIAVLKDLVPIDPDDLDVRKRLAQMLLDEKRYAEAEQYARTALEIDVLDKDAREVLDKALAAQKKEAEAERIRKLLGS
jgi:tetratricopeptide (TPR) repeat protein